MKKASNLLKIYSEHFKEKDCVLATEEQNVRSFSVSFGFTNIIFFKIAVIGIWFTKEKLRLDS